MISTGINISLLENSECNGIHYIFSSGNEHSKFRQQKVKIYWNVLYEIDIPDVEGTVVYQRPMKTQKTA